MNQSRSHESQALCNDLRNLVRDRGISQESISKKSGLSLGSISNLINGNISSRPRLSTIKKLEKVLEYYAQEPPSDPHPSDCEETRRTLITWDEGLLPWSNEEECVHYISSPFALHKNFVGRHSERKELTHWITSATMPRVLLMTGLAGVGKTANAWVWWRRDLMGCRIDGLLEDQSEEENACRVPEDYPLLEGVFYWRFASPRFSFPNFLDVALRCCSGNDKIHSHELSVEEKFEVLLALLVKNRFLLILDNFEEELLSHSCSSSSMNSRSCKDSRVGDFLRQMAGSPLESYVMIISRRSPAELDGLAALKRMSIQGIEQADALNYMKSQNVRGDDAEISDVCAAVGCHPGALHILSEWILSDPASPGDCESLSDYGSTEEYLFFHASKFGLTFRGLTKGEEDLLHWIAAFPSPPTWGDLTALNLKVDHVEFKATLRSLINEEYVQLDRTNNGKGMFIMHPIQRICALGELLPADRRNRLNRARLIQAGAGAKVVTMDATSSATTV